MPASPPPSSARPFASAELLADLAHAANRIGPAETGPEILAVERAGPDGCRLASWSPPAHRGHPVDPLVGFRAPDAWDAVGFTSRGRLRDLAAGAERTVDVVTTVLASRDGPVVTVIDGRGEPPQVLDEPPEGLVADVLARVLGRSTPPAATSTAALAELTWLDRVASGLGHRRPGVRSWRWLADRHPFRGSGALPSPGELALRTRLHAARHPWSALRARAEGLSLPAATLGPPGGVPVDASTWFDDGALARWTLAQLPGSAFLAATLGARLTPDVIAQVAAALTEVTLDAG